MMSNLIKILRILYVFVLSIVLYVNWRRLNKALYTVDALIYGFSAVISAVLIAGIAEVI